MFRSPLPIVALLLFFMNGAVLQAQLNGTYVIDGGGGGDYLTFNAAVADLTTIGISGPVIFEVADGTYNEQVSIPAIAGSSPLNTITFRGQSLDSTLAIVDFAAVNGPPNYAVQLAGVQHIYLEHLTIRRPGSGNGRVVHVLNGSSDWTFAHCQLAAGVAGSLAQEVFYGISLSAFGSGTIEHCRIWNGMLAEFQLCNGGALTVRDCVISDVSYGIWMYNGDLGLEFSRNRMDMAPATGSRGFRLEVCSGPITITHNRVRGTSSTFIALLLFNTSGTAADPILVANNMFMSVGSVLGQITAQGTVANMDVVNNTLSATGSASAQCLPLVVGSGGGHRIHNNIFHTSGFTFRTDVPSRVTSCDNNVYHSTSGNGVQWGATYYTTIPTLVAASGMHQNCLMTDPVLVDPANDLHLATGSPCAGAGSPWPGVIDDVDGEGRPQPVATAPDIGADESPSACGPMAGTYVIGPSLAADFPDFTSAVAQLTGCGISAPVVFEVESGTYVEAIQIPAISGTSSTNTITFRSQAMDSTAVSLEYPSLTTFTPINHVIYFDGGDHITFEHMTIARTGTLIYANVIRFSGSGSSGDPSQYITLRHNRIMRDGSTGTMVYGFASFPPTTELGTVIESNRFEGPSNAIGFSGETGDEVRISGNVFDAVNQAISTTGIGQLQVWDNDIQLSPSSALSGMTLGGSGMVSVLRNRVITGGAAEPLVLTSMFGSTGSPALVANNTFINTGSATGIQVLNYCQHISLVHNSVSTNTGKGFWVQGSVTVSDLVLTNNILRSGSSFALEAYYGSFFTQVENNLMHSGGPTLAAWGGTSYTDLGSLQSGTGGFASSLEGDPLFVDPLADLHLQSGSPCMGNGLLIPSITDDLDGEVRPQPVATQPDIGADEHPDACGPLAGTYVIGASAVARFPSFSDAVNAMVTCGLAGPVVFEVEDGTYTEQIVLPNIPGNSNVNTIMFRGQSLDSSLVELTWPNGSTQPTVRFSGADRVSFEHLTISRTGAASLVGRCVDWESTLADGTTRSEHISFRHCQFLTSSIHGVSVLVQSTARNDENNVVFEDSRFAGGYIGLHWQMDYDAITLEVRGCSFTGQRLRAIQLNNPGTGDPEVYLERNDIDGPVNPSSIAVDIAHNANLLQVIGNRIQVSAANGIGLQLSVAGFSPSWQVVRNNMIACSGTARGIVLTGTVSGLGLHYNSVSTATGYPVQILASGSGSELIGNILRSASSIPLYRSGTLDLAQASHNVLWTAGPHLAVWSGFHADLPCLQAATGQHQASASVDPQFIDPLTDLHLQSGSPCTGQGIALPGLVDGFDGDPRSLPSGTAPDIGADEIDEDCTLLAGTYVIGPSVAADFNTFTEAVDRIVGCGITGPVVFEVESGTYVEQLRLGAIKGSSSVNTVTFRGQAMDSTAVVLQWPSQTTNTNDHLIEAAGGDHVRFEHMTLRRTGPLTFATVVRFNTGCESVHDLRFGHCVLTSNGTVANTAALVYRLNTGASARLDLQACRLEDGSFAVFWDANGSTDTLSMSGCVRTGGTLGIRVNDVAGPVDIVQCQLTGTFNSEAVLLSACSGPIAVLRNKVDGGSGVLGTGIHLTACAPLAPARAVIANNHVNFSGRYGLRLNGVQQRVDVLFNSVHINTPGGYGLFSAGNGLDMQVHNNVFSSAQGYAVYNTMTGLVMDHNCPFRGSPGPVVYWNGTVYPTIAALNAGTGTNANSLIADPRFYDPLTDLHTYSMDLNGAAAPFGGITADIDGDPRDPATPDIGCDEFTPQLWNEQFDVCMSADPAVSDGSGRPIWIYRDRKVIARILENGNTLGAINSEIYIHTGPVRQSGIGQYYMDRNWRIEPQNPITGAGVDVRLFYHADEFAALAAADPAVTITSDAGVSQYDGPNENCLLADNTTVGDYFIHFPTPTGMDPGIGPLTQVGWYDATVANFSEFYITTQGLPLPVELLSFTGERLDGEHVRLDWSTASEQDNAGFEIWRRIEGESMFQRVGWVDGAGSSQQVLEYSFLDPNPTERVSYYHLRQYDHDGAFEDSPVVAVVGRPSAGAFTLYPNPTEGLVHLAGDVAALQGLEVMDQTGRIVLEPPVAPQVDLSMLPTGTYMFRLVDRSGASQFERLVVR